MGFPVGASGKEPACQRRKHKSRGFDPWVVKIPWRRARQPTPGFLPGESHGQRSLVGCSPYTESQRVSHNRSDLPHTHTHTHTQAHAIVPAIWSLFLQLKPLESWIFSLLQASEGRVLLHPLLEPCCPHSSPRLHLLHDPLVLPSVSGDTHFVTCSLELRGAQGVQSLKVPYNLNHIIDKRDICRFPWILILQGQYLLFEAMHSNLYTNFWKTALLSSSICLC